MQTGKSGRWREKEDIFSNHRPITWMEMKWGWDGKRKLNLHIKHGNGNGILSSSHRFTSPDLYRPDQTKLNFPYFPTTPHFTLLPLFHFILWDCMILNTDRKIYPHRYKYRYMNTSFSLHLHRYFTRFHQLPIITLTSFDATTSSRRQQQTSFTNYLHK